MNGSNFDREISFDIVEHLGVITTYSTGWNKELNLVSWNGAAPKYDIREWSPDHAHMSRGVTLHEKEMRTILDLIRNRNRKSRYDSRGAGSSSVSRPGVPDGETQRRREERDDGVSTGQRACAAKACSETAGGGDAADREEGHGAVFMGTCDDHGCISCADDTEPVETVCGIDEAGYEEDGMNSVF